MAAHAYIKLVSPSEKKTVTLKEVKQLFQYYQELMKKTGEQLGWGYQQAAFPYQLIESDEGKGKWFYLKGDGHRYRTIIVGVGSHETGESFVQITLPDEATHGDKGKANEFCKFLAKKLEGELHLFSGRIMYYYKR
ncbi:DUF1885 family protein [Parageobacillus thermoglucosidasius]|uniref:DUF1885 family protein n=1 Tax=Parageobacillus thermoglucosidasius TaxID=1426 RepID=A0AAN1D6E2_PARTM|nr:DUF1885 family protein [Parageobacillus thermoglucosidasius]REK54901.1 MAG: DUF1885 domain-containing protein [Geobacillus sp.]ALF10008.1 hypothetical protein AOT13_08315 [Parageobacillus thermoglucosidasius]ANZ30089.1 hypothetical protein BCV53_08325 [Parageobacillus thermoglucosidasius]APM80826.1 hypothetical protein BCV54_08330 [Parageobacillus thermoglucosidasius]KJX70543.1 hypothetical protein WH82_00015 [Parageobacillus thermoglucosidasius]